MREALVSIRESPPPILGESMIDWIIGFLTGRRDGLPPLVQKT